MLIRLGQALLIAIVVWLVCILIGGYILPALQFPPAAGLGAFLEKFAVVIGMLAGAWYWFFGYARFGRAA